MKSVSQTGKNNRLFPPATEVEAVTDEITGFFEPVVMVTDRNGLILNCNPQITALTGYSTSEIVNRNCSRFLVGKGPAEEAGRLPDRKTDQTNDRDADRRLQKYRSRLMTRDGQAVPVELKVQNILCHDQPVDLIIIQALTGPAGEAAARPGGDLVENVIVIDPRGNIEYISEAACRLNGWRCAEVLGRNLKDSLFPQFHNQIDKIIDSVCRRRTWTGVIPVYCPDGDLLSIWISLVPVFDIHDNVASIIGAYQVLRSPARPEGYPVDRPAGPRVGPDGAELRVDAASALNLLNELQARFSEVKEQLNLLSQSLSRDELLVHRMHAALRSIEEKPAAGTRVEVTPKKYRLEIYTLGGFRVCSLTRQIQHWPSNRAKAVFEFLINKHTSPVSRDILMGTLWPEYSPRAAANNLKTAIHDLRQILNPLLEQAEPAAILNSHDGYLVNPEIELLIDAEAFELLWNQGKDLEKHGRQAEAMAKFEKAEALYQGDYLEDSLYADWTIARRETLKDLYLFILNKLADYALNTADYENCITCCHKILGKDNCREDTYRMLMSSYSRLRQKNNALRWYENCRQTLLAELGAPPSPETVSLFNLLKRDEAI